MALGRWKARLSLISYMGGLEGPPCKLLSVTAASAGAP